MRSERRPGSDRNSRLEAETGFQSAREARDAGKRVRRGLRRPGRSTSASGGILEARRTPSWVCPLSRDWPPAAAADVTPASGVSARTTSLLRRPATLQGASILCLSRPQSMGNVVDAPGAGRAKDRVPRPPSHQPPGSGHVSRGDAARLGLAVTPFAMEPPWGRGQASRGFKRWMPRVTSRDRPCQPPARQERARRRRYQVPVLPVRGGERVSVFTASVYEGPILSLNNTLSSSSSDHDPLSRRGH